MCHASPGTRVVVIRDPASIEYILRAEGKYPVRDLGASDRYAWLFKHKSKETIPFAVE